MAKDLYEALVEELTKRLSSLYESDPKVKKRIDGIGKSEESKAGIKKSTSGKK